MLIGTAIRSAYGLGIDKVSPSFCTEGIAHCHVSSHTCWCQMQSAIKSLKEPVSRSRTATSLTDSK